MTTADFEAMAGSNTEHIYIGDEFSDLAGEPRTVSRREQVRNRVNGTVTELTFYEEGFLKVRETGKNKRNREHVLELRFMQAEPVVKRQIATRCLWSSLSVGLLALLVSFVLPTTGWAAHTFSASAILATVAVVALLLFIYRSEQTHQFRTASGKAVVLSLTGSFGCIRRMRTMAREVKLAIAEVAQDTDVHDVRYLRAEMKAHYKLAETGVITREACSNGTSLILSKFG